MESLLTTSNSLDWLQVQLKPVDQLVEVHGLGKAHVSTETYHLFLRRR